MSRVALFLSLALLATVAQAATYHVAPAGTDSVPCAQAQTAQTPRRTINGGIACLQSGDTLLIGGGTYVDDFIEDFRAPAPPSGQSWAAPTTIKAAPGATVWLTATQNSEGGFISLGHTRYLVIEGLNLNGLHPGGGGVFTYGIGGGTGSSHIRYQHMEIKHFRTGIKVDGDYNEFLDLEVHSIGKPHCPSDVGCQATYISGNHNLIAQSRIHDNDCMGALFYKPEQAAPTVGNTVRDSCLWSNGCAGAFAQAGNTIAGNVIHHNLVGIQTTGSTVIDNWVWENREGDLQVESSTVRGNRVGTLQSQGAPACTAGGSPSPPRNLRVHQ